MMLVLLACATTSATSSSATASALALTPEESAEAVKSVVKRQSGQVAYCYESRLKENPALAGRMEISFVVSAGQVVESRAALNTTGDDALADCVVARVSAWRFSEGVSGEFTYPFTLSASRVTQGGKE